MPVKEAPSPLGPPPEIPAAAPAQPPASPTVALFQKAHSKLVSIQRIEDQMTHLVEQRRKLQEELRQLREQINGEFDRILQEDLEMPKRTLTQLTDQPPRMRVADAG